MVSGSIANEGTNAGEGTGVTGFFGQKYLRRNLVEYTLHIYSYSELLAIAP